MDNRNDQHLDTIVSTFYTKGTLSHLACVTAGFQTKDLPFVG